MKPKIMTDKLNANITTVKDAKILKLTRIDLDSGALTSINSHVEVPFGIKRVYYLYDVPNNADRGAHAHKELWQLIIAASGSFEIELVDATSSRQFILRQPNEGLLVPPGLWRDLKNFSGGGVCMVLASEKFDENDYIRRKEDFFKFKTN